MAVIRPMLTVTIAFPVWNDSCVNSTTIVLSSYCIFCFLLHSVGALTHNVHILLHISCSSLNFYLNFWTKCPKVAFMYIALKGTKKHLCYLT